MGKRVGPRGRASPYEHLLSILVAPGRPEVSKKCLDWCGRSLRRVNVVAD